MEKKYHPLDEKSTKKLTDIFKELFGDSDPFSEFKREHAPIPLKKKGDTYYEVQWHTSDLEKDGHKVLHVAHNRFAESVMIYRVMYGDGMDDENIHLRVKVISLKGVKAPDSNVHLHIDFKNKQHLRIADIKIEGDRVNRGYGSILMEGLMKLVQEMQIRVITGWISSVDWDHIDRSEHFYKKHGFDCKLDHENKHGTIRWKNEALGYQEEK
ncbi:hypothetical protein [Paenibacillus sp. FSL K6-2862]|uniref:hypothetical protein n=1 Tax=Paenibacillus sp. FSL K6-2862 TaxID=2921484 RepID=UPI0030F7C83E